MKDKMNAPIHARSIMQLRRVLTLYNIYMARQVENVTSDIFKLSHWSIDLHLPLSAVHSLQFVWKLFPLADLPATILLAVFSFGKSRRWTTDSNCRQVDDTHIIVNLPAICWTILENSASGLIFQAI